MATNHASVGCTDRTRYGHGKPLLVATNLVGGDEAVSGARPAVDAARVHLRRAVRSQRAPMSGREGEGGRKGEGKGEGKRGRGRGSGRGGGRDGGVAGERRGSTWP